MPFQHSRDRGAPDAMAYILQRALDSGIAPGGIVGRHPHDEPINVDQHVMATGLTSLEGPFAGDQLPMPAK